MAGETTPETAPDPASEPAPDARAERARNRTVKNMIWALLACFAFIAVILLLSWRPDPEREVKAVDYTTQLAQARKAAPYDVLAPTPMPAGWTATSVQVGTEPLTWHLGILTADRSYVGLEQSPTGSFVADKLGPSSEDGTSTVAGATWQRRTLAEKDERALVRTGGGVTTIVTGTADYATLETFAATLR